MEPRKLLYITDAVQSRVSGLEHLEKLCMLGFKEVIVVSRTKLEGLDLMFSKHNVSGRWVVPDGRIVPVASNTARAEAPFMIAFDLNRDKERVFTKSAVRQLLDASDTPVIVLPREIDQSVSRQETVLSHIIFATDWSKASEKAFQYILAFKDVIKALEVVNVVSRKLSVRNMRDIKQRLTDTRRRFVDHRIDAEVHVYAGKRPKEIMLAARDYGASCIVMGGNGKGPLKRILFSDCAGQVAGGAMVPTLVVP